MVDHYRRNQGRSKKMPWNYYLFNVERANYFFITLFSLLLTINKKSGCFKHNPVRLVVVTAKEFTEFGDS